MHKRSGFTLIELMIVICVIAIIAAIAIPAFKGYMAGTPVTGDSTYYAPQEDYMQSAPAPSTSAYVVCHDDAGNETSRVAVPAGTRAKILSPERCYIEVK